jgi:(Z)-2-((N-methylformamido)methylene)-5-hydroxybutyrolactone dehydrogenase
MADVPNDHQLFINGKSVFARDHGTFDSIDPSTGRPWGTFSAASADDVDDAVAAADRAFNEGEWPRLAVSERARLLRLLGDAVRDSAAGLADLETTDNGKAIRQTRGELAITPQWYWYFAGAADKVEGRHIPVSSSLSAVTTREPLGVVAAIVPFNSPVLLTSWKLGPALAAGNTVVVKPAPDTPATALRLAQLAAEVGFPPGVINVVCGGDDVGQALVAHPQVSKIAFTGASETGAQIAREAAATLKRVSCEGGGKSAHIVFPDANLDQALTAAAAGVFISAGQTCVAGSRLLIQSSIFEQVVSRLAAKADALLVGPPMQESTHIGALTSQQQLDKVSGYVDLARAEGAHIAAGGTRPDGPGLDGGYYFRPTVISGVSNRSRICQEEIFGPVVSCLPFDDEQEAIAIANDVKYGLAGGVWTNDIRRARRVSAALRVGTVWVNNYRTIHWQIPFGGVKASGYGRENGLDAINDFTQVKTVVTDFGTVTADPFTN